MRTVSRVFGWLALVALVVIVGSAQASAGTQSKTSHHHGTGSHACCIERHVEIQANGYTIPGTFTTRRAGGAHAHYPAVLLLHGTASQKDEVGNMYLRLAQKLGRLGYASLRIDFAGSGDSTLPQTAFTYSEEVARREDGAHLAEPQLAGRRRRARPGRLFAGRSSCRDRRWHRLARQGTHDLVDLDRGRLDCVPVCGPDAYATGAEGRPGDGRSRLPDVDVFARVVRVDQELAPAAGHRRDTTARCSGSTAADDYSGRRPRTSCTRPAPTTRRSTSSRAPTTSTTCSTPTRRRPRT